MVEVYEAFDMEGDRRVPHTRCEQRFASPSEGSIIRRTMAFLSVP